MPRILYTAEQKLEAKKKATERNKKWAVENKDRFDTYMKSYYQLNKERLNARKGELRQIEKDRKDAEKLLKNDSDEKN